VARAQEQLEDLIGGKDPRPEPASTRWTEGRAASALRRGLGWVSERPLPVLIAVVVAAVAFNFFQTRGQTLYSDEWGRLYFPHHDFESLLRWRTGHLVVLQVMLYKGIFEAFGADSYLPFRIVEAALVGTCGVLFYALARTRARPWPSVAATAVLVFLGSSYEVLATPYGIVILLPIAFGLAALVCLERFPGRGDPLACLLLVAAVASQSDGLAFVVAATVLLALRGRRRLRAGAWVVAVPVVLYAIWSVWYRATQTIDTPDVVQLHNVGQIPSTIVSVCAAGLSAASGFFGTSGPGKGVEFNLEAGFLLLGVFLFVIFWRARAGWRPSRGVWIPVAAALVYWGLLGMVASSTRVPSTSRYLFPSAVFLLLILLELVRDVRPQRWVMLVGTAAVVVSLVPNLVNYNTQARNIRAAAGDERAQLGAYNLLRDEVPATSLPRLSRKHNVIRVGGSGFEIPPRIWFDAVDRYGSPAASPAGLAAGPEARRLDVDRVLLQAGDLDLSNPPAGQSGRSCRVPAPDQPFTVPLGGLEIRPQGSRSGVTVAARRFAAGVQELRVPSGSGPMLLKPGASQAGRPWLAQVDGAAVCFLGS
jgi:hypothetical protein